MNQLDNLDQLAGQVFDGYLVKKDLAQRVPPRALLRDHGP
jgi:hypothetical protein